MVYVQAQVGVQRQQTTYMCKAGKVQKAGDLWGVERARHETYLPTRTLLEQFLYVP